jgi:hypothetical protein
MSRGDIVNNVPTASPVDDASPPAPGLPPVVGQPEPPPAPPSLPSESLVAITGIFPSRHPSELMVRAAQGYMDRVRRRLVTFLAADTPEKMKWERPPAQDDLWKDITTPLDEADLTDWLTGVPHEMGLGYALVIDKARSYIRQRWPIFPDESLDIHNTELAQDEYGDVWQIVRTLDKPDTLFDDMDALILLPDQVDAFAEIYPTIYQKTVELASLLLQPFISVNGMAKAKRRLSFLREEQMRTLMRLPLDAPIAAPPEPQKKDTQKDRSESSSDVERRNTPASERVADKMAAK